MNEDGSTLLTCTLYLCGQAVTMDGEVYSWGKGDVGQLGLPHAMGSVTPANVKALQGRNIVSAAAGAGHSAAIAADGSLYTWGANECG